MRGTKTLLRGRGKTAVWELRVSTGLDPGTGKYGRVSRTWPGYAADDPTVKTADQALAKLVAEVEGDKHSTGTGTTVDAMIERWLRLIEREGRSPLTLREYRRLVAKRISPALGALPASSITFERLDAFYDGLTDAGLGTSQVRQIHSILRAAFKQGVRWKYAASNPAVDARPPKANAKPDRVPTPAEVQRVIAAAEATDPDIAAFIALAAVTGARRGELCGLRWSDIDWDEATLTVERSVAVMGKGNLLTKDTKTHAVRRMALDKFGATVLRRHRIEAESRGRDLGRPIEPTDPVFTYDMRRPIAPDTVSHAVKRIADRAGVDMHLHSLRHFAATQLIGAGVDVRTVAGRLGHKDASTTLRVYAHALPERDRDAAGLLGKALTA